MIGDGITGGRIGKTVAEGVFVQNKIKQRCQISRVSARRLIRILREHHVVLRDDVGLTK
jgi:response regulator of citrate/malate metabolism